MAKQWWALAVATAMTMSSGAALASNVRIADKDNTGSSTSADTTNPSSSDANTKDTTAPVDSTRPVDDATKPADTGDRLNQSGSEVGAKLDAEQIKITDLSREQVKKIQEKLKADGFFEGTGTGVVGPKTRAALQKFAESKGAKFEGDLLDAKLLADLDVNASDIQPVKGTTKSPDTMKMPADTGEKKPDANSMPGMDMPGMDHSGMDSKPSTDTQKQSGSTEPGAKDDVQPQNGTDSQPGTSMGGMDNTGRTDMGTSSSTDIEKQRGADTGSGAMTGQKEVVRQAQLALKAQGLLKGEANGTLDKDTTAALKSFQKSNQLPATGKLDHKTLAKLGVNEAAGESSTTPSSTPSTMTPDSGTMHPGTTDPGTKTPGTTDPGTGDPGTTTPR